MRPSEDFIIAATLPRTSGGRLSSLLDIVLQSSLDESYFGGAHQHLFRASISANILGLPLDDEVLNALLLERGASGDDILKSQILFRDLLTLDVSPEKVKVLIPAYKDYVHASRMAGVLEDAVTVLTEGAKVDGEWLEGYKPARTLVMSRLAELDAKDVGVLPTKDIRVTADELLDEYERAKNNTERGILTGFHEIDALTNGVQKGELWIWCAYTSEGKSQCLINVGYNAVVHQKKNVAFVSMEMPLAQVRRRMISRHSNHPTFGLPGGLDYVRIKDGKLDPAEEKLYGQVITDWKNNSDYGIPIVLQISKAENVKTLSERLMYIRSRTTIDLLVLDYASLLSSVRRRSDRRDEIVEVVEGLKALCLTFNEGEGLACVTANQVSRKAREEAESLKKYGLNFASETSAIEKNADLLAWLLRTDEMKANKEILMGVAKYRDGDVGREFTLMERYESSLLTNLGPSRMV